MALNPEALRLIRPMAEADLDAVAAIEAATFPDPWPKHALAYEALRNPYCASFVVEMEDGIAAYAFCWVVFEQAHLINIAVEGNHRGRGFGEALLTHVLRYASAQGAEALHLEVREANASAIGLYLKHGFTILGRKDKYYGDGAPALLMVKDLTKP